MRYRLLRGAAIGWAILPAVVTQAYPAPQQSDADRYTVQRSTEAGVPTCEISGPAGAPLQLALAVSDAGEAFVSLINPAWQLGPDSHGTVMLAVDNRIITPDFRRVSATRMTARLGGDNIEFLKAVFAANIKVTFPGNRSVNIEGPDLVISNSAKSCMQQLHEEMSLRGDPFAVVPGAPAPSSGPGTVPAVPMSQPNVVPSDLGGSDDYYVQPPARAGDINPYCGIAGPSGAVKIELIEAQDSGFKLWVVNERAHFNADHYPVSLRIGPATFTRTFDRVNDTTLSVALGSAEQADDAIVQLFDGRPIEIAFPGDQIVRLSGPTHKVRNANWACLRSIGMPAIGDLNPLRAQD